MTLQEAEEAMAHRRLVQQFHLSPQFWIVRLIPPGSVVATPVSKVVNPSWLALVRFDTVDGQLGGPFDISTLELMPHEVP